MASPVDFHTHLFLVEFDDAYRADGEEAQIEEHCDGDSQSSAESDELKKQRVVVTYLKVKMWTCPLIGLCVILSFDSILCFISYIRI